MDSSRGRALCGLVPTFFLFATPVRVPQALIETAMPTSELDPVGGGQPISDEICVPPIQQVDTSHPTTVVGIGTPESCTEEALDQAIGGGGVITFDCGGETTIPITSEKELRTDVDTTLDGQAQITLDGNGVTRLFSFVGPSFRQTTTTVTLQNLRLINARATGTPIPEYPDEPPQCARGFDADGGGAAIFIRDGILHVFNTTFENNRGEPLGPDVAGGAIYGLGSLGVIVVGSHFTDSSASNGGHIGALNTDLSVYNSTFHRSAALGHDGEGYDPACPADGKAGSGGAGGAILIDGGFGLTDVFCGDAFTSSQAGENALGGAIFRSPDFDRQITMIDQCTFDGNFSPQGGGALFFTNSELQITRSTFTNNASVIGGVLQAGATTLQIENSTFANNDTGLAWAVAALFDVQGEFRNCTFVGNSAGFAPIVPDFTGVSIENSIFLGNYSVADIGCGTVNAGSGNLQWPRPATDGANSLSGCVDGVSVGDPVLSDLGDHGGPTWTFLPGAGSQALGLAAGCPLTDQRSWPRPDPNACTSGSVEVP
jgi:parallel beta helix pectate lyase-like protein